MLVANVGDAGVAEIAGRLGDWHGQPAGGGPRRRGTAAARRVRQGHRRALRDARSVPRRRSSAAITAAAPAGTTVELHGLDPLAGPVTVTLPTAGRHNAANALGVAGAAATLGLGRAGDRHRSCVVRRAWAAVSSGRERSRGVSVYDDYGHHPTAIRATIAAVRQREPGRRVWAVYEPLTYHRTAALLGEFAAALATADAVAIADIWAGRDPDTTIASAGALAAAVARLRPDIPARGPGIRRGNSGLAGRRGSGRAMPSSSWAGAAATGSGSDFWSGSPRTGRVDLPAPSESSRGRFAG